MEDRMKTQVIGSLDVVRLTSVMKEWMADQKSPSA